MTLSLPVTASVSHTWWVLRNEYSFHPWPISAHPSSVTHPESYSFIHKKKFTKRLPGLRDYSRHWKYGRNNTDRNVCFRHCLLLFLRIWAHHHHVLRRFSETLIFPQVFRGHKSAAFVMCIAKFLRTRSGSFPWLLLNLHQWNPQEEQWDLRLLTRTALNLSTSAF